MTLHRYLLDTNILSDLIKNPAGAAAQKITTLSDENMCCTSLIVACELRYGAHKKSSPALTKRVEQLLSSIAILPLEENIASHYAELRTELERRGQPIGGNDLLIASHACAMGLIIVTANTKEFTRIPELAVENWLE
ncbi:MAG: type II toxin-antitoxin system VapC family toxin [Thermodesulfobacteriota bacterium]|nr:type II toxin-antitoxin system VapC family toxin [Thermodesulfobacteriota bacterium]